MQLTNNVRLRAPAPNKHTVCTANAGLADEPVRAEACQRLRPGRPICLVSGSPRAARRSQLGPGALVRVRLARARAQIGGNLNNFAPVALVDWVRACARSTGRQLARPNCRSSCRRAAAPWRLPPTRRAACPQVRSGSSRALTRAVRNLIIERAAHRRGHTGLILVGGLRERDSSMGTNLALNAPVRPKTSARARRFSCVSARITTAGAPSWYANAHGRRAKSTAG